MKTNLIYRPGKSPPPAPPEELFAPLEWRVEELDRLRLRVRELMLTGLRRSEASQVAFAELTANRALERARTEAAQAPAPPESAA
jgi:hypothetical protein